MTCSILLEQVTVSLDDTLILHGGGDKKLIEERCEQVFIELLITQITLYLHFFSILMM